MSLRTTRQQAEVLHEGDGDFRATRQYVEYVYPGDGDLRITRQYVEVLHENTAPESFEVEASDTLDVADDADAAHVSYVVSSDTIDFSEQAYSKRRYLSIVETLAITEGADRQFIGSPDATDTLLLAESSLRASVTYIEAFDFLRPSDWAARIRPALDVVGWSESANRQLILGRSITDTCDLSESADRQLKVYKTHTATLSLSDSAACEKVLGRSATDTFSVSDDADVVKQRPALDSLSVTDTAVAVKTQHGADTLLLTDEANAAHVYLRESIDFLRPHDTARGGFYYACSASDSIDFTDASQIQRDANDTLALSDAAVAALSQPAVDTLSLSDTARVFNAIRRTGDTFDLSDVAVVGKVYYRAASDIVDLSDTINEIGPNYVSATDVLQTYYIEYGEGPEYEETVVYVDLAELAEATVTKHRSPVSDDELTLEDLAAAFILNATHVATASDSLVLTDTTSHSPVGGETETLDLSDSAAAVLAKPVSDTLDLSDSADRSVVYNIAASDDLDLAEALLAAYSGLEDYVHIYHPFVGEGPASNPTPPPTELSGPIAGITVPFQLVYPVTGPFTDTLTLRAPNLGNRERFQGNRVSRETRGGTLIVFADNAWPKIRTLVLNFSGLTSVEAQALHTFIDAHLGQEIGLMDWEHRYWSGVITTFDTPIVQDGRGCKFSVGFEFEGELTAYSP